MERAPSVSLLGHSFVRRYRTELVKVYGKKTDFSSVITSNPNLPLYIEGLGGLKMSDPALLNMVSKFSSSHVILEIGTNDLCNFGPRKPFEDHLKDCLKELSQLILKISNLGVTKLILMNVVRRSKLPKHIPQSNWDQMEISWNKHLFQLKGTMVGNMQLDAWRHERAKLRKLTPDVSKDQLHYDTDAGLRLYHKSITNCFLTITRC